MSEIKRFDIPRDGNEFMHEDPDGEYVLYDDHLAEMFRMRADVERLTQELDGRRATNQRVMAERDAARANAITDAREKNGIISRVVEQRDAALAEVERLRAELTEAKTRIQTLTDDVAIAEMDTAGADAWAAAEEAETARVTAQRDAARVEVERLNVEVETLALTLDAYKHELNQIRPKAHRLRAEVEQLRANGQGMLDTSRPTDEDIWREGFMRCLNDVAAEDWHAQADLVLTTYRKRWPR